MKIQMPLISIVTMLLLITVSAMAVTLIMYTASINRASAFLSQERLAAEQAQSTKQIGRINSGDLVVLET